MDYITIKEASEKWDLSVRRVQDMCKAEIIPGIVKFDHAYTNLRKFLIKDRYEEGAL